MVSLRFAHWEDRGKGFVTHYVAQPLEVAASCSVQFNIINRTAHRRTLTVFHHYMIRLTEISRS